MEIPEPLVGLVSSARRRLWASRMVGDLAAWLGVGACGAAALWGLSRVVVLPWSDQAAWSLLTVAVIGAVGWRAAHRPSWAQAALWADQRLGGADRLATAWELAAVTHPGPAVRWQITAAGRWAAQADRGGMGGEYPSPKTVTLSTTALAAALALAIAPSFTDQAVAEQQAARLAVERELEVVESLSAQNPEELSDTLGELAESLSQTDTLEEAISALSATRLDLEKRLSPNRLAENTALAGLASRLAQTPVGQGDDPASQLSDLAASLQGLSAAERQAVASELAERAADFAGTNEELAAALAEAASALAEEGFDLGQASEALQSASSEVAAAQVRAASAGALAEAAAALQESEGRLQAAQTQNQQGGSQGASGRQGQGADAGSDSQGQGDGGGQGQGQGSAGGSGGQGPGSGGGGQTGDSGRSTGSVGGGADNDPAAPPSYSSTVFEPPASGLSEQVRIPVEGDRRGELAGTATGPSVANQSLVPYTERLAEYRAAALASLERRALPAHLSQVVQTYFTELEP